ncbi:putative copper resistance protein D [Paracoccus alcaliphilus]|uniref:Putative copper resistance protein D n=1 Tax=Paracoccus alcaliphilus TaxID=34002 RepID=A0A1H8N549_9RHOB|nr:copper homeostasis membrane protein CopD [Paracoccus alcaliphilus]WCR18234.1 copper homeostasis membrane protein CopD [Paracoccus alcaliphilus]SEO24700.1 putative copper resistance protein D [Paracoccus alcaliphilus]
MADPGTLLILCRMVVFGAALMIWGAALFRWRLTPDAAPVPPERVLPVALLAALAAQLPVEVARIAGDWSAAADPGMVLSVIGLTSPGQAWLVQALAAIALIIARQRQSLRGQLLGGLLLMAGLSMTGHAAASGGMAGLLRQVNHVLHLAAAGAWIGALPYVLCLLRRMPDAAASAVLMRYSGEGHFWVALVLLTGLAAMLWTVGGLPLDWVAPYQALLSAKIAVVAAMVGLALRNRYVIVPRLRERPDGLAAIARATRSEIALGLIAAALVAWLATLDPH